MSSRLAKLIEKMVCNKARELYAKYKAAGKEIYADFIKESLPECFPEEEGEK